MTEITTKEIQSKFKIISEQFATIISSNKEFMDTHIELRLILNKINSNITAIMYLMSKAMFNEACIIFRSMFESIVLFEYLIEFPDKMEQYNFDDLVAEYHKIFLAYKRKYIPKEDLINSYNELDDNFKQKVPFEDISKSGIITYNDKKLENFFKSRESKPLSQQTTGLIKQLLTANSIHSKFLYDIQMEFYNVYSQVCHTRLNTLLNPVLPQNDSKTLAQIQEMYKNCMIIYKIIGETLDDKFNIKIPQNFYQEILKMGEYLQINYSKI